MSVKYLNVKLYFCQFKQHAYKLLHYNRSSNTKAAECRLVYKKNKQHSLSHNKNFPYFKTNK